MYVGNSLVVQWVKDLAFILDILLDSTVEDETLDTYVSLAFSSSSFVLLFFLLRLLYGTLWRLRPSCYRLSL